jgi:hypothetical protein
MDAADLGQWQRTRRCVPREASRTLLPEAPRLPKTARTSGRAARDPAASCPPVSVQAPVLRKELVHAFPTPYTDETLPGGCVPRTARRFAAGRLVRGRVYADTAVLRDTVEGVTPT